MQSILEKLRVFFCISSHFCYVEWEMGALCRCCGMCHEQVCFLFFKRMFSLLDFLKEDERGMLE
ncbi:hypothetical protein PY793_06700 [Acetobacter fabarum]|uniref:hypothetical protein n=1 Tax=Acetobacter fabarum TaxID=483199 RepID=UPI00312BAABF